MSTGAINPAMAETGAQARGGLPLLWPPDIRAGRPFEATVIRMAAPGTAVLRVANAEVQVRSPDAAVPFLPGEEIRARVSQVAGSRLALADVTVSGGPAQARQQAEQALVMVAITLLPARAGTGEAARSRGTEAASARLLPGSAREAEAATFAMAAGAQATGATRNREAERERLRVVRAEFSGSLGRESADSVECGMWLESEAGLVSPEPHDGNAEFIAAFAQGLRGLLDVSAGSRDEGACYRAGAARLAVDAQAYPCAFYLGEQDAVDDAQAYRQAHFCVSTVSLGDVACEMGLLGSRIGMAFTVNSPAAQAKLESALAALESGLRAEGFSIDKVAVTLADAPWAAFEQAAAGAHLWSTEGMNQWI